MNEENKPINNEETDNNSVSETNQKTTDLTMTQTIALAKSAPCDIEKEAEGFNYVQTVEDYRKDLMGSYNKSRKISNIMMIVAVLMLVISIILISQNKSGVGFTAAGYSVAGATLVGMIIFSVLTKKKFPNKTKDYIANVTQAINRHNFNSHDFTEMKYHKEEKADKAEIIADRLYKDIYDIGSRNMDTGLYKGHGFTAVELAAYVLDNKRKKNVVFLGKSISTTNDLHFEGRIIISLSKMENAVDVPTDIEGLNVEEKNAFKIYTDEASQNYEKILGKKFLSSLSFLTLDELLLNVNIVIWAGRCVAYLSYEDAVISLPFEKPFDGAANEKYVGDLKGILDSFDLLRK